MISISTTESNTEGNVIIDSDPDYRSNKARLARVKTLDGGVVINHFGTSVGDITLIVETELSTSESDKLWTIFENSTNILISIMDGLFLAAIKDLKINNGKVKITIYIEQKEN